jgi:hypothetical protein
VTCGQGERFDRSVSIDGSTDIDAAKADVPLLLPTPINSLAGAACFWLLQQKLLQLNMSSLSVPLPLLHHAITAAAGLFVAADADAVVWPLRACVRRKKTIPRIINTLHE